MRVAKGRKRKTGLMGKLLFVASEGLYFKLLAQRQCKQFVCREENAIASPS